MVASASGRTARTPNFSMISAAVSKIDGHGSDQSMISAAVRHGCKRPRAINFASSGFFGSPWVRFGQMIGLAPPLVARMFEGFERQIGLPVDSFAAQHHAPRMAAPALVVHDLEDDDVPWDEGERYARLWPDARLLSTTGLGHHRIAGDAMVIEAALRFLRGEAVGERVVSSPNLTFGFE